MTAATPGAVRFARFAFPPNALGYCGPDAGRALLHHADAGVDDDELRRLAAGFDGARPYLEVLGRAADLDPLDARVVEAYWLGNGLLDRVPPDALGPVLEAVGGPGLLGAPGRDPDALAGARAHHGFQVFVAYPWLPLLATAAAERARYVLDRCRIRWGRVVDLAGDRALVRSRPLRWDGRALALGPARPESVRVSDDGARLDRVAVGDTVALHWDWVCERLGPARLRALRRETATQLASANLRLARAPAHPSRGG